MTSVCLVRTLTLCIFATAASVNALGDCSANPSVGVSVAPQPSGVPIVTIAYSFPDTGNSTQRTVTLRIHNPDGGLGNIGSIHPDDASGTWVVNHLMSCALSGTYTYDAEAVACNGLQDQDTATYDHDVQPTVDVSYDGPDEEGHGSVIVNYSFPNTGDFSQRHLQHRIYDAGGFGTGASMQPTNRTGTWIIPYNMTCRTGHFEHEITATSCSGTTATDRAEVDVDTKPTVSVSTGDLEDDGDVPVTISYNFPNTDDSSQRTVVLRYETIGGGFGTFGTIHPTTQSGTWNVTKNMACELANINAWAIATSCSGQSSEAKKQLPKPGEPTISVALAKSPTHPGMIEATIDYDMGKATGSWSIRLDGKAWIDTHGISHPGQALYGPATPATRTGTIKHEFAPPWDALQIPVQATAATCAGRATDDASFECDACEATANPVFLSSGNVLVTDGEPLPEIGSHMLVRNYNSDEQIVGLFGRGWTTLFDRRMIISNDGNEQVVSFLTESNQVVIFRGAGGLFRQTWPKARAAHDTLQYDVATGTYLHRTAGSREVAVFRASDGLLIALRNLAGGREAQIAYDPQGLPITLTDSWTGTQWALTIDTTQRVVTSIAVTDHPDIAWTYSYDGAGNLVTVTAPGAANWRTYDYSANRMTASYDALGNLLESHTYDADGYGISSTGPTDEISSIAYNLTGAIADERVTRVTYKTGATADHAFRIVGSAYRTVHVTGGCSSCGTRDVTYVRDREGRITREQHADGYITTRAYTDDLLTTETRFLRPDGCDPESDAQHCRLTTDALATTLLSSTSATLQSTLAYEDALWPDSKTQVIQPSVLKPGEERRETYDYDAVTGDVVNADVSGWSGEDPAEEHHVTTTSLYDAEDSEPAFAPGGAFDSGWLTLPQPSGLRKAIDGPRSDVDDVTSFVYYPIDETVPAPLRGHLAATRNAAGHITRYEGYDVFGRPARIVDPNEVATAYSYDLFGRLETSTLEALAGCDTSYDPLCATDLVTQRVYDGAGPLSTQTSPGGRVTKYTYDARGRAHTISRGPSATDLREQLEYGYDSLTGKKSLERILAWESGAWVEKKRETFGYDADARLQTVTHADTTFVQYSYDSADRLSGVRDENHVTANTHYTYDPAGRIASVAQTLAGAAGGAVTIQYGYDFQGNLISVTDPNGNVTQYTFDDFGHMLAQTSPVTGVTTNSYDEAGHLVSSTDANGATTVRSYDAVGRALTAASTREDRDTENVSWVYDADYCGYGQAVGRLSVMSDPTGETAYCYERRGLLKTEQRSFNATLYGYDEDGNRDSLVYPAGRVVSYTFDFANRPASVAADGTPVVTSVSYLPFGPRSQIAFANGTTTTIGHDDRYRVSTNALTDGSGTIASYAYQYDGTGNITQLHDVLDATYNRDFVYDDLNRLTTANSGTSLWGSGSYQYDGMGNVTSFFLGGNSLSFSYVGSTPKIIAVTGTSPETVDYDAAGNELADRQYSARNLVGSAGAFSHLSAWTTYGYDGRGVRASTLTQVPQSTPVTSTSVYSPELRLLSRSVSQGLFGESWTDYIWLSDVPVAQLSYDPAEPARFTFTDHLGTPILQTDATGAVIWRAEYEPYGGIYSYRAGTANEQILRLPGQEENEASPETYYNIFRWYRAGWGRYSSADPLGLRGGLNLYRYAGANPLSNTDRLGLVKWNCDIGYLSYETPGAGVAGATLVAKCQSECVKTKRVNATVMGNSGGASAGSPIPVGVSYSEKVMLNDDFAEPKEDALGGLLVIGSIGAGIGIGPLNWSFTYYRLGAANGYSTGTSAFMVSLGIDAYIGAGAVVQSHTECCN